MRKDMEKFIETFEEVGIKGTLEKSIKSIKFRLVNKLLRASYRSYIEIRGKYNIGFSDEYGAEIIKNPYQVVIVPIDLIEYCISPYATSHISFIKNKDVNEYNPPARQTVRPIKNLFITEAKIKGLIINGDWDVNRFNFFDDSITHSAFRERFLQNKLWSDTLYYKRLQILLNKKGCGRGNTKTFEEYKKKYLKKWDNLYQDIKNNGYKTQKELGKSSIAKEIEVGISRKGEILLIDGKHRFSIAKILDIEKIPVIVNVWQKEYIEWLKENKDISNVTPKIAMEPILDGKIEEIE